MPSSRRSTGSPRSAAAKRRGPMTRSSKASSPSGSSRRQCGRRPAPRAPPARPRSAAAPAGRSAAAAPRLLPPACRGQLLGGLVAGIGPAALAQPLERRIVLRPPGCSAGTRRPSRGPARSDPRGSPASNATCERSRSVSSMRSRNRPPCRRANSQLTTAARALPRWRWPVGLGANRTVGGLKRRRQTTRSRTGTLLRVAFEYGQT